MERVVIWNTEGRILHVCESESEAADIIEECGYTELHTNYSVRDKNICVSEF